MPSIGALASSSVVYSNSGLWEILFETEKTGCPSSHCLPFATVLGKNFYFGLFYPSLISWPERCTCYCMDACTLIRKTYFHIYTCLLRQTSWRHIRNAWNVKRILHFQQSKVVVDSGIIILPVFNFPIAKNVFFSWILRVLDTWILVTFCTGNNVALVSWGPRTLRTRISSLLSSCD